MCLPAEAAAASKGSDPERSLRVMLHGRPIDRSAGESKELGRAGDVPAEREGMIQKLVERRVRRKWEVGYEAWW